MILNEMLKACDSLFQSHFFLCLFTKYSVNDYVPGVKMYIMSNFTRPKLIRDYDYQSWTQKCDEIYEGA